MKVLLFLGAIGLFVAGLYGEFCPDGSSDSCKITMCANNTKLDCHAQNDPNIHVCTCVPTADHTCTGSANLHDNRDHECDQWGDCHGHGTHWHCIQGTCRCFASHGHGHDGR